jgi:beta-amylase
MLSSLAACAQQVGQPHWGTSGPHDAGSYCQWPHQTGFFHHQGSWTSEYGHFFLQWYTQQLLQHGDNVLREAASVFGGSGVRLYARLPVIFWWYNQSAHAAELTAGWYNTADRDGYLPALQILADHGVGLQLAAGELRDCEQPGNALASPEHLLLQLRAGAAALHVPVLLTNYGSGFEQHLLSELERKAFEGTCYMGVDIEPAAGLQFNSMSDIMFESQHWGVFKDWVSRVRRRAQELAEAQQQLRVPGSSSGSRHEQRPRLPSRQGTVSSAQLVQEAGQLQQQAAAAAAAAAQQQQRQAAVYV